MNRRSFLGTPLAASLAGADAAGDAPARKTPDVFELRCYALRAGKEEVLDAYLRKALVPAARRLGLGPVGVFTDKAAKPAKVHVLLVHPSGDSVATLPARLAADAKHAKAAREYLAAPAGDPVYSVSKVRCWWASRACPGSRSRIRRSPRLLNLRIYESHNERAARKKIEMFNKGELAIFRRVGLRPVFFGETVVGAAMPNLTYLLVFADEAAREAAWARFRDDPEWLKLKAIPEYADKEIVSNITNKILTPTAFSEI